MIDYVDLPECLMVVKRLNMSNVLQTLRITQRVHQKETLNTFSQKLKVDHVSRESVGPQTRLYMSRPSELS